jgi:hypothetical protein
MFGISIVRSKDLEQLRRIDAAFSSIVQEKDGEIKQLKKKVKIWKRVAEKAGHQNRVQKDMK